MALAEATPVGALTVPVDGEPVEILALDSEVTVSGRRLPAHAFLEMTVDEKGWSGVLRDRFRSLDLVRCAGPVPSGVPCRLGEGVSPFAAAEGQ